MEKSYPTSQEYARLAAQWQRLDRAYRRLEKQGAPPIEVRRSLRLRNRKAEQILLGLDGLIWKHVRRWVKKQDLAEVCYVAAQQAVAVNGLRKWDPRKAKNKQTGKKTSFTSYICHWIDNGILHSMSKEYQLIYTPVTERAQALRSKREGQEIPSELKKYLPTVIHWDQMSKGTAGEAEMVSDFQDLLCFDRGLIDKNPVMTQMLWRDPQREVLRLSEYLTNARERDIFLSRAKGETLQEIGDRLGCTREWIRQVEASAFAVIRKAEQARLEKKEHAQ